MTTQDSFETAVPALSKIFCKTGMINRNYKKEII